MDLKYLPRRQDESGRRYLFVPINRATRWVFAVFKKDKSAPPVRVRFSTPCTRPARSGSKHF